MRTTHATMTKAGKTYGNWSYVNTASSTEGWVKGDYISLNAKAERTQQEIDNRKKTLYGDDAPYSARHRYWPDRVHSYSEGGEVFTRYAGEVAAGELRGRQKASVEFAIRLRNEGMSNSQIHQFTDLSLEEIGTI